MGTDYEVTPKVWTENFLGSLHFGVMTETSPCGIFIVLVRPTTDGKVEVMDTGSGNGYESGKPGKRERQSINQSFRQTRRGQVKYFYYK